MTWPAWLLLVRRLPADDFGVDPSPELVAPDRAVALDNPSLRWTPPGHLTP